MSVDYEGDRALAKRLLEQGEVEAIALALRKHWHDGYKAGKHAAKLPNMVSA